MGLARTLPPTMEPLSLVEVRLDRRLPADLIEDDPLLERLIASARDYVERDTGYVLMRQTWQYTLDRFPLDDVIELPIHPVAAVSGFTYVDPSGVATPFTDYDLDRIAFPQRIVRKYGLTWPETRCQRNAIVLTLLAGVEGPEAVPPAILEAMRLLVGHWYENREAVVTGMISTALQFTVDALLERYRVGTIV